MRVLVVCTVHDPRDARIRQRQIAALLAAGHEVTQAGPFTAFGATPGPGVRGIDLPRATGRDRLRAMRKARSVLREEAPHHDVVVLHSPELLAASAGLKHPAIVWDVHEDTAAAVSMKSWIPSSVRPATARSVRWAERRAEGRYRLILAESAYAERFRASHPVVPNTPPVPERVPPSKRDRAVYLGTLTEARGGDELIALAPRIAPMRMEVMGTAHGGLANRLRAADRGGILTWHGFVDNERALALVEGATLGLSLLHDEPNYRHSMPTKLLEYLAHGVPFVSTPLPLAQELAARSGGGVIVPFGDIDATARAVLALNEDDPRRTAMASAGHAWVRKSANWDNDGPAFVALLEAWAGGQP